MTIRCIHHGTVPVASTPALWRTFHTLNNKLYYLEFQRNHYLNIHYKLINMRYEIKERCIFAE